MQKKIWFLKIFLFFAFTMGCSDLFDSASSPTQISEDVPEFDLSADFLKNKNSTVAENDKDNMGNIFDLEQEYKRDCYVSAWFYCPPTLFSDELWEFEMVSDVCLEPPEVVYVGECQLKFECDPADTQVEQVVCVYDNNGTLGLKDKWCDKGNWKFSDCVSCQPEICNGLDDDCDGEVDEGILPSICIGECGQGDLLCVDGEEVCYGEKPDEEVCDYVDNDCDGEIDEGQLNACGLCGDVPEEVCNGIDDDCDGEWDENLTQKCETECGVGIETCYAGMWTGCSAKEPIPEFCDGQDNDCDGEIDEGLDCLCTLQLVGALLPCTESPLECGQGFKTCECANLDCTEFNITPCLAACSYNVGIVENQDQVCDPYKGFVTFEICNNHDDNCNGEIDENLYQTCYTGPPETANVGLCKTGQMVCEAGVFGGTYQFEDGSESFVPDLCVGEVLPAEKDECNGEDDNCDGDVDDGKELVDTDILFIVDASGSMLDDINSVMAALNQFALSYKDEEVIQWGLIFGPLKVENSTGFSAAQYNKLITNLVPFSEFSNAMASMSNYFNGYLGGIEAVLDLLYMSIHNLVPFISLPHQIENLSYNYDISSLGNWYGPEDYYFEPSIEEFKINWRQDSNKVIIIFSDEITQSYLKMFSDTNDPSTIYDEYIKEQDILSVLASTYDLKIYPFTPEGLKDNTSGFASGNYEIYATATGGKWYELSNITAEMYLNLMEIIGENACE